MHSRLRGFLGFSKREMNGVIVAILLIILFLSLPSIYRHYSTTNYENYRDQVLLDSLVKLVSVPRAKEQAALAPFIFDPNQLSQDSLELIGVPPYLAERINNYRRAGGRFKRKEELKKIYGFPDSLFLALSAYISISGQRSGSKQVLSINKRAAVAADTQHTLKAEVDLNLNKPEPFMLNINSADTTDFQRLYGIGTVYSKRMVKYRELLGGFTAVDQIKEVYGISDSLFASISVHLVVGEEHQLRKVAINLASFRELNAHPYISYKQTQDILNSKSKVGKYRSISDLLKLNSFDSVQLNKLLPYLDFK